MRSSPKVHGSTRPSQRTMLRAALCAALLAAPVALTSSAKADDATPADLWRQFSHYTLIGRVDMASKAADGLLADGVEGGALLDGIESTATRYHQVEKILEQASHTDGLAEHGKKLADKIQNARMARAKEPARIIEDISRLGDGARIYANAVDRLRASGPYAVPFYVKTLQDQSKARLHAHVLEAMVEVGAPVVYPTAVALPHVDFGTAERLADALGRIGTPAALPTLKMMSEDASGRETSRKVFASAAKEIEGKANLGGAKDTADLFTRLSKSYYDAGSRHEQPGSATVMGDRGVFWSWHKTLGLSVTEIPANVLADRMAMQAAESALALNPNHAEALTLHLAANARRENVLAGTEDNSYKGRPPESNLLLAGPVQQQNVLAMALANRDVPQALDAIKALSDTMDDYHFEAVRMPLLDTLLYSDIRVRIHGALALANANPKAAFPGSNAVVPTLGQAVVLSEQPSAIIVAPDEQVAKIGEALGAGGFRSALGGKDLQHARAVVYPAQASVDMIVYTGTLDGFKQMMSGMANDGLLMGLPIVAVVDEEVAAGIRQTYPTDIGRISTPSLAVLTTDGALANVAKDQLQQARGKGISGDDARSVAARATAQLREIAIGNLAGSKVYQAIGARSQLISALSDAREDVAQGAARVLECFDDSTSQDALLKAALAASGDTQRVQFASTAKSFEAFGKKVGPESQEALVAFVKANPAISEAARALGAMNPEPKQAVEAILAPAE